MTTIRNRFGSLAIIAGFMMLPGFVHAQETATLPQAGRVPLTAANIKRLESFSDTQLEALLNTLAATPTISADSLPSKGMAGNFLSLAHPNWPPLPGDIRQIPVWNLGSASNSCFYLLDDLDYPESSNTGQGMRAMDDGAPNPGFDGTNSGCGSSGFQPQAFNTNGLWLEITNVADGLVYLNLHNATNEVYAIWTTTNLLANWNVETEVWPTDPAM